MKNRLLLIGLITFLGAAWIFNWYLDNRSKPNSINGAQTKIKKDLAKEFQNSYPQKADKTGETKEFDISASPSEVEIYNGTKTKVWAYNGTIPGPQLRIELGDTLKINFTNNLPQETTIHFHGVRVPNAMDGVPGVTQDPIKPGEKFVYEFTPKDAGTFWFHPHNRSSEQMEKGLYGTLIVEDPNEPKYAQDVVWVLDDWRLTGDAQIDPRFNTAHDISHDGRWGNTITVNGKTNESLNVKEGERIRLRLVNTSNARVYKPDFSNLNAKVIAVDGMLVKTPFDAKAFELAPGNRVDLDIKITNDNTVEIWESYTRENNKLASIIVGGETNNTYTFDYPSNPNIPDWNNTSQITSDANYELSIEGMGMHGLKWRINGKSYPQYDSVKLENGKFYKITLSNTSFNIHPMHIHGQFFKVLSRNGLQVDEPYWRDTVLLSSKETVDIGIVPLDNGKWANHCHILEHAEAGMMTILEVI